MTGAARETSFRVRMSAEERRMLEALAVQRGLSASDWVRLQVRDAYAATKPPKPRKK